MHIYFVWVFVELQAHKRAVTTASAAEESSSSSWELQRFVNTVMFFSGSPVSLGRMFKGPKTSTKVSCSCFFLMLSLTKAIAIQKLWR